MRTEIVAHRWVSAASVSILLALVSALWGGLVVSLPLMEDVPLRLLIVVAATTVALLPLYSSFPELEATLPRERLLRPLRLLGSLALTALAVLPSLIPSPAAERRRELMYVGFLLALGYVAVVVFGALGWAAPLTAGVLGLVVDGGPAQRLSHWLDSTSSFTVAGVLVIAGGLYTTWGARRWIG